jgi:hypothetical protein
MINRTASHRQLDLLVFKVNAPELSRIPRATRGEVTALLKLLMAEHLAVVPALPPEAGDE